MKNFLCPFFLSLLLIVVTGANATEHLLNLLLDDAVDSSLLFPDRSQKYYKGQIELLGRIYVDTSMNDSQMALELQAAACIEYDQLSDAEKSVVDNYYRLLKQKYEAPWYLKYISKKVGYGIYAAADIEKGQLIGEYAGIIYDEQTYKRVPRNANYCWNLPPPSRIKNAKYYYVDSIHYCNFTRFINHSYRPNVVPVHIFTSEGPRMLYVAARDIEKDEQILVNYGQGYWRGREPEELD